MFHETYEEAQEEAQRSPEDHLIFYDPEIGKFKLITLNQWRDEEQWAHVLPYWIVYASWLHPKQNQEAWHVWVDKAADLMDHPLMGGP